MGRRTFCCQSLLPVRQHFRFDTDCQRSHLVYDLPGCAFLGLTHG